MSYGRCANGESQILILFFWFVVYLNQTIWLKPVGHTSPSPSAPLTLEITISWNFLRVLLLVKKMSYLLVRMQSYITFSLVFADWCVRWGWGSVRLYRARGGHGGQQGYPANGPCSGSISGRAGTQSRGGEGGRCLLCYR